jgi:hypothetical protein
MRDDIVYYLHPTILEIKILKIIYLFIEQNIQLEISYKH